MERSDPGPVKKVRPRNIAPNPGYSSKSTKKNPSLQYVQYTIYFILGDSCSYHLLAVLVAEPVLVVAI